MGPKTPLASVAWAATFSGFPRTPGAGAWCASCGGSPSSVPVYGSGGCALLADEAPFFFFRLAAGSEGTPASVWAIAPAEKQRPVTTMAKSLRRRMRSPREVRNRPYTGSTERQSKYIPSPVLQGREIAAHLREPLRMYGSDREPFLLAACVRQDFPPRIYDAGVSKSESVLARWTDAADLRGREHVGLVLDGPRPKQDFPVSAAGVGGERGRHAEEVGAGVAVQLGEAQVVADGEANLEAEAGLHRARCSVSRRDLFGFAVPGAVGDVDVEQVELAVGRGDLASRRDERAGVVHATIGGPLGDRAGQAIDAPPGAELADARELGPVDRASEGLLLAGGPDVLPHLGKAHQRGAAVGRLPEERESARFVRRPIVAGSHLDRCGEEHAGLLLCLTITGRSVNSGPTFSDHFPKVGPEWPTFSFCGARRCKALPCTGRRTQAGALEMGRKEEILEKVRQLAAPLAAQEGLELI